MSDDAPVVAWFHCFAGIAGDMALGSLIDAGADVAAVRDLLSALSLPGWELEIQEGRRGGVACTRAIVHADDSEVARTHADIVHLIEHAALPARVVARSLSVFARLAEAEARLHGEAVEAVHFHEVGGHDALIDIVGTVAALEVLGIDEVTASPVAVGTGMVRSAHGPLPNPSPAAVRLLEGAPTYGRDTNIELTTPTGAALLAALATSFGPMPSMRVTASGFGAGAAEMVDLPNCTQVVIGQRQRTGGIGPGQACVLLEVNLDDVTGEQLGAAVSAALDGGAHDAWVSAVTMKKGRPGHVLHVLGDIADLEALRDIVFRATGTFGVRATTLERWPLARRFESVSLDGMVVRMKVGPHRAKPEFDDVAAISAKTGLATSEVAARAEAAWRETQGHLERSTD